MDSFDPVQLDIDNWPGSSAGNFEAHRSDTDS